MHKFIRNTHLILGMTSVLFVLLYAVSAAQMAHKIRLAPTVAEEDVMLGPGLAARPAARAESPHARQTRHRGPPGPVPRPARRHARRWR